MTDDNDLGCLFCLSTGAIVLVLIVFCFVNLVMK